MIIEKINKTEKEDTKEKEVPSLVIPENSGSGPRTKQQEEEMKELRESVSKTKIEKGGGIEVEDLSDNVEEIELSGGVETKFQRAIEKMDKKDPEKVDRILHTIGIKSEEERIKEIRNEIIENKKEQEREIFEQSRDRTVEDEIPENITIKEKSDGRLLMDKEKEAFIAGYKEYLKTRSIRESLGVSKKDEDLPEELQNLKSRYRDSKVLYMKSIYGTKKQEIFNGMEDMLDINNIDIEKAKEVNRVMEEEYFSAKIFNEIELSQQEEIQKAKIGALGSKEQNLIMKGVQWYGKRSFIGRMSFPIAVVGGTVAGISLAGGAAVGVTAGAFGIYAGQRVVRSVAGILTGGLFGKVAGKIGENTIKNVERNTKEEFSERFNMRYLGRMEELAQERVSKIENIKKRALIAKIMVSFSASMIAGRSALDLLHNVDIGNIHNEILNDIGLRGSSVDSVSNNASNINTEHLFSQNHASLENNQSGGIHPDGVVVRGIEPQSSLAENIHKSVFSPEVLKEASEAMKNKITDIYKYKFLFFSGSQAGEWTGNSAEGIVGIKDMKVSEIIAGNFGNPFHGGMDAAQENNREQLLKFLNELKTNVNPIKGETTGEYVKRALAVGISTAH